MTDSKEDQNITVGRDIAIKFDFYFIGLIFTVLALTIQTSHFDKKSCQYIFEILAWLSLAIAGLAGLSRLEWMPVLFKHYGYLQVEKSRLDVFEKGLMGQPILNENQEEWSEVQLKTAKEKLSAGISKRKEILEKKERWNSLKYRIQKYGFAAGILLLIISRGVCRLPFFIQ